MPNIWLVAKHEYGRIANRRAFIILTLAVPLAIAALITLIILLENSQENHLPVGYVDHTGLLDEALQSSLPEAEDRILIRGFPDEAAATAALEQETIQAFFVLPAAYPASLETELYYLQESPSGDAWGDFNDFVRLNLLRDYPTAVQQRLLSGAEVRVEDVTNGRTFTRDDINIILPFIASLFFILATMSAASYMLEVVTDEKENKTMEVLLTSLTPGQLITGKIVGLMAVILTQLGIYLVTAVVALLIATPRVAALQEAIIPWTYLGVMAVFFLPSYLLLTAVTVAIGSAVTSHHQGQQVAGLLNLLFMAPVFLTVLIFQNPGGPVVVFMSLFPPTAFLTISLRWGLGTIPLWQLGVSLALLVLTTLFMIWTAVRIFRLGMLRYGQPLPFRQALKALRLSS